MVYDIATKLLITGGMAFEFEGLCVEIIRFSHMWLKYPECIDYHAHINYEFHYISRGEYLLSLEENETAVGENQFYICPPFTRHRQRAIPGTASEEYCVECKLTLKDADSTDANYLRPFLERAPCRVCTDENGLLAAAFCEMETLCENQNQSPQEIVRLFTKTHMLSLLTRLIALQMNAPGADGETGRSNLNHTRAVAIKNYLDANLTQPINVQECAQIFGLSPRQIDRVMLAEFNHTFYRYLMWMRVNVAVNLLETTSFSVEEISERAGFTNYRQMIRCFKAFGYLNPSALRRGMKRGEKERTIAHE